MGPGDAVFCPPWAAVGRGSWFAFGGKWRELHQHRGWQSRASGGLPEEAVLGSGIISFQSHHSSLR